MTGNIENAAINKDIINYKCLFYSYFLCLCFFPAQQESRRDSSVEMESPGEWVDAVIRKLKSAVSPLLPWIVYNQCAHIETLLNVPCNTIWLAVCQTVLFFGAILKKISIPS